MIFIIMSEIHSFIIHDIIHSLKKFKDHILSLLFNKKLDYKFLENQKYLFVFI